MRSRGALLFVVRGVTFGQDAVFMFEGSLPRNSRLVFSNNMMNAASLNNYTAVNKRLVSFIIGGVIPVELADGAFILVQDNRFYCNPSVNDTRQTSVLLLIIGSIFLSNDAHLTIERNLIDIKVAKTLGAPYPIYFLLNRNAMGALSEVGLNGTSSRVVIACNTIDIETTSSASQGIVLNIVRGRSVAGTALEITNNYFRTTCADGTQQSMAIAPHYPESIGQIVITNNQVITNSPMQMLYFSAVSTVSGNALMIHENALKRTDGTWSLSFMLVERMLTLAAGSALSVNRNRVTVSQAPTSTSLYMLRVPSSSSNVIIGEASISACGNRVQGAIVSDASSLFSPLAVAYGVVNVLCSPSNGVVCNSTASSSSTFSTHLITSSRQQSGTTSLLAILTKTFSGTPSPSWASTTGSRSHVRTSSRPLPTTGSVPGSKSETLTLSTGSTFSKGPTSSQGSHRTISTTLPFSHSSQPEATFSQVQPTATHTVSRVTKSMRMSGSISSMFTEASRSPSSSFSASHQPVKTIDRTLSNTSCVTASTTIVVPPAVLVPVAIPQAISASMSSVAAVTSAAAALDVQTSSLLAIAACAKPTAEKSAELYRSLSPFAIEDSCYGVVSGNFILIGVVVAGFSFLVAALHVVLKRSIAGCMAVLRCPSFILMTMSYVMNSMLVCSAEFIREGSVAGGGFLLLWCFGLVLSYPLLTVLFGTRRYTCVTYSAAQPIKAVAGLVLPQGYFSASQDGSEDYFRYPPMMFSTALGGYRYPWIWVPLVGSASAIASWPCLIPGEGASPESCQGWYGVSAALHFVFAAVVFIIRPRRILLTDLAHCAALLCNGALVAMAARSIMTGEAPNPFISTSVGNLLVAITGGRVVHSIVVSLHRRVIAFKPQWSHTLFGAHYESEGLDVEKPLWVHQGLLWPCSATRRARDPDLELRETGAFSTSFVPTMDHLHEEGVEEDYGIGLAAPLRDDVASLCSISSSSSDSLGSNDSFVRGLQYEASKHTATTSAVHTVSYFGRDTQHEPCENIMLDRTFNDRIQQEQRDRQLRRGHYASVAVPSPGLHNPSSQSMSDNLVAGRYFPFHHHQETAKPPQRVSGFFSDFF